MPDPTRSPSWATTLIAGAPMVRHTPYLTVGDIKSAVLAAEPGSSHRVRDVLQLNCGHTGAFYVGEPGGHGGLISTVWLSDSAGRELCTLIDEKTQAFTKALERTNLPKDAIAAIISFVDFRLDTQAALHELEIERLVRSLAGKDTSEMGTAEELAAALGMSAESVRRRTHEGRLFAVLGPGRKRGREYPMFQAWPGVAGEPLEAVLKALNQPTGAQAYQFMTSPSDFLGGLTPIEVLVGDAPASAELAPGAREFLLQDDEARLRAVTEAAAHRAKAREAA
jgi:hypothetical protein